MKNLLYIFGFVFLCACVDKSKMQDLKGDIQNDLIVIKDSFHQEILKEVEKRLEKISNVAGTGKKDEYLERFLIRANKVTQKYLEVIELFRKNSSHKIHQKNYRTHIKWLNKIAEEYRLDISFFKDTTKLHQFLANIDDENIKEKLEISISQDFAKVMAKLGMFPSFRSGGFTRIAFTGFNGTQQIEEGEAIELKLVFSKNSIKISKAYDNIFNIDKGNIQEKNDIFYISIPTQKLGKQNFTTSLTIKNWKPDKDTTLYFTKTFEVIE